MKKSFLLAAGLALTLTACQKDEGLVSDAATSQTITVTIPQSGIATRATAADFGDGSKIDRCILQVYRNEVPYGEQMTVPVSGNHAIFNLRLVASQTYDFVFWADCSEGHYNTADLSEITVNGDYAGNNDEFDAFFYCLSDYEVRGTFAETVTLKRPFGQLNVKTTDLTHIPDPDLKPTHVKVAFTAVPTTFNAVTGVVGTETAAVEYTAPVINGNGELSVDYLWASPDEAILADFSMTFLHDGAEITTNDDFRNIPIRRNYRTSVSGNLLTKKGSFDVTIDPIFEGETPVVINGAVNVTTGQEYASLAEAVEAASASDVIRIWGVVDEDITLDKDLTIEGGSEEASAAKIRTLNLAAGISATIENVQFFGARDMANSKTSVLVNNVKDVTFRNCLFDQEEADGEGMRPIETAYGFTGKLTLENCTVRPGSSNPYFNAPGESGELVITGSTFEQIVTIDPLSSADAKLGTFVIENNTFKNGVATTALSGAEDAASLSAAEKAFANGILSGGNTFGDETKKIKVFSGSHTFYVNDPSAAVYNRSTGAAYDDVAAALAAARSGEVILASGLTCADELTVRDGVTLDGGGSSVFTGKLFVAQGATLCNLTSEWAGQGRQAIMVQGGNVTLENLNMVYEGVETKPKASSNAIVASVGAVHLTVKDCRFTKYWKGLYLNSTEGLVIEGCTFDNMNPFSTDKWDESLSVQGNTFIGNTMMSKAIQLCAAKGTEGIAGTTKYQESWPLALKESVYGIFKQNTFENQSKPYIRVTSLDDPAWDYDPFYFCVTDFLKGNLDNAHNAFKKADRQEPSAVEFLDSYEGEKKVLHYTLNSRTNQANRADQSHFRNTQGLHFEVFNPARLTQWEVSGRIWVDAQMIADQKPFRSELWTSSKYAATDGPAYPMLGIANVIEDEGGIYQSTMDHAGVRIWGDAGWSYVEGVMVDAGWHTVRMVSDGTNVTYYFDGNVIGKLSSQPKPVYLISVMPQAFHYDYQHTDGRWFYEGYTCDTYFCGVNYKLKE